MKYNKLLSVLNKNNLFPEEEERKEFISLLNLEDEDLSSAFLYGSSVSGSVNEHSDLDIFLLMQKEPFKFYTNCIGSRWISICSSNQEEILNDISEYSYGHLLAGRFVNPVLCFKGEEIIDTLIPKIRAGLIIEALKWHYYNSLSTKAFITTTFTEYEMIILYFRYFVEYELYFIYPLNSMLENKNMTNQFVIDFRNAISHLNPKNIIRNHSEQKIELIWETIIEPDGSFQWLTKVYKGHLSFWTLYQDSRQLDSIKSTLEIKIKKISKCKRLYQTLFSDMPHIKSIKEVINAD